MPLSGSEYLTSNAKIAYPFKENASGLDRLGDGAYGSPSFMPIDALSDADIAVSSTTSKVYLYRITRVDAVNYLITFVDQDINILLEYTFTIPSYTTPYYILQFKDEANEINIRFVITSRFNVYLSGSTIGVINEFSNTLEFEDKVINISSPKIKAFTIDDELDVISGDVKLTGGYNILLENIPSDNDLTEISVVAGSGIGLGQVPCDEEQVECAVVTGSISPDLTGIYRPVKNTDIWYDPDHIVWKRISPIESSAYIRYDSTWPGYELYDASGTGSTWLNYSTNPEGTYNPYMSHGIGTATVTLQTISLYKEVSINKALLHLICDKYGGIIMEGGSRGSNGSCYNIIPHHDTNSIEIQGNCYQCCSCDDYLQVANLIKSLIDRTVIVKNNLLALHERLNVHVLYYNSIAELHKRKTTIPSSENHTIKEPFQCFLDGNIAVVVPVGYPYLSGTLTPGKNGYIYWGIVNDLNVPLTKKSFNITLSSGAYFVIEPTIPDTIYEHQTTLANRWCWAVRLTTNDSYTATVVTSWEYNRNTDTGIVKMTRTWEGEILVEFDGTPKCTLVKSTYY